MRLGKTGVHFLNPYGVRSLRWMVWQSRASSAECRPCITRSCGICNRLNIQFLNVVTGSQGNELTPREEARWKGGRSSQLALVSLYCVLHKHITYSKLTRGVQACSRGDCTFSRRLLFFSSLPYLLSQEVAVSKSTDGGVRSPGCACVQA